MRDLAFAFLRLGTTAFGGPAAHIAMMEDEFVRRRAWLSREQFLDLVGAAALIPGPSSTEVALFVGFRRAGWRGLVVAGLCFILPAALLVTAIAALYARFGKLPAASSAFYGIKPVIVAIIVQALIAFARAAIKSGWLLAMGIAAAAATLLGAHPVAVLTTVGLVSMLARIAPRRGGSHAALIFPAKSALAASAPLSKLFLVFLKIGAIVFGSGYTLLAFLETDLVKSTHWLTESQLMDAVAAGQLTPGPVFTTATFIGYLVAGIPGAFVATVAIFLPSFLLVAVSGPFIPRIRRSRAASAFLDGVNVASLGLMAVVCAELSRAAIVDVPALLLALASGAILYRWRVNSAWLICGGALVGSVVQWLR